MLLFVKNSKFIRLDYLEPAGRVSEQARRALEPARRALEPAGRPGASWEGQLRGRGGRRQKEKRTEGYQYVVVP